MRAPQFNKITGGRRYYDWRKTGVPVRVVLRAGILGLLQACSQFTALAPFHAQNSCTGEGGGKEAAGIAAGERPVNTACSTAAALACTNLVEYRSNVFLYYYNILTFGP